MSDNREAAHELVMLNMNASMRPWQYQGLIPPGHQALAIPSSSPLDQVTIVSGNPFASMT